MTIKQAILQAADSLAYWRAELICPTAWGARDYGAGYCRAIVNDKTSFLRQALSSAGRGLKTQVGATIRHRLAKALKEQRALVEKQRRAA